MEKIVKKIKSYSLAVKSLDAMCHHRDFRAVNAFLTPQENENTEDVLEKNLLSFKLTIEEWWNVED